MFKGAFLTLFIALNVNAQENPGARFTAMGNSSTSLHDVYSLGSNQAGIARLQESSLALVYVEHFIGSDIRSQAGMGVMAGRLGVIGLYVCNYGLKGAYSQMKTGLSYARMFGPRLAMALTINYHQLEIPKYGTTYTFSPEFGIQYLFNRKWAIGFHIANPANFSFDNEAYAKVPVKVQLGTNYRFSDQVLIAVDTKYILDDGLDGSIGLEYALIDWFKLRGGISIDHFQQYTGFGFNHRKLSVDIAVTVHPRLGVSPQFALCYAF